MKTYEVTIACVSEFEPQIYYRTETVEGKSEEEVGKMIEERCSKLYMDNDTKGSDSYYEYVCDVREVEE